MVNWLANQEIVTTLFIVCVGAMTTLGIVCYLLYSKNSVLEKWFQEKPKFNLLVEPKNQEAINQLIGYVKEFSLEEKMFLFSQALNTELEFHIGTDVKGSTWIKHILSQDPEGLDYSKIRESKPQEKNMFG